MDLPVPHFSYEDLRAKADEIRDKYDPEKQVPVPIEHIVEFGFGVTIIPLPGLQDIHEVDAFMSHDCETMYVDKSVMEHRSPNRYRFPWLMSLDTLCYTLKSLSLSRFQPPLSGSV